ncbi:AAA family ATPase [Bacillus mexicanus]|uniref:AAA family ATPase n=1 Tax=Bacillus mexicanus TaxID=2834415 RepID=UPI003D23F577
MSLEIGLEVLQNIFDNQGNDEFKYLFNPKPIFDSILIKPLKKRHIVTENINDKKTRDADIRFEGNERFIFPVVENFRYQNDSTNKGHFKKWYLTQIPVRFSLENCGHMFHKIPTEYKVERNFYFSGLDHIDEEFVKVHLSKEKREGERISLGYKEKDDHQFYEFRKLLFEGDYLIVCKYFEEARFLFLGAKKEDLIGTSLDLEKTNLFIQEENKIKHTTSFSIENNTAVDIVADIPNPHQWLISGAPGTGKSHMLKVQSEKFFKKENIYRVTFHQNYTYGQFIGTFKPVQTKSNNLVYRYQPGMLLKVLLESLKNPTEQYVLIIDELNRGNTNEIFGDFLQLIERDKNGRSTYEIEPTEDLLSYLEINHPDLPHKMSLPSNLYIWGTLNNSDQYTLPIDSAFFRRWKHHHIGIDENEHITNKYSLTLPNRNESVPWNKIRKTINKNLSDIPFIKEDQLLGPFFIKPSEDNNITSEEFFYDVVLYLKENVFKDLSNHFFTHSYTSEIKKVFMDGGDVFHFSL